MKKGATWIVLAFIAAAAGLVAWMTWSGMEKLDGPSQPYASELASNDVAASHVVRTNTAFHSAHSTNFAPLVARQITPPPAVASPQVLNRTPTSPASTEENAVELDSLNRGTLPPSPRTIAGGSVNPFDGTPEHEIIGIGAVLLRKDGALQVRDVLPGSPAALANLSGCSIQSVDGVNVVELSMEECVRLLRGAEGSTVKLEVIDLAQQRQTVEVVRNKVQL
ncbi:MAG TPA: PDZ domain-containing protein [Candidatus Acidoferrum sp.]|nr:PDZ domain-containing protein [Candidatus Acidoferrum sp.]